MSEKTTKRVAKKENRTKHKERYHRCAFITDYTQKKYGRIYEEANSFYEKLFTRYPTKTKLMSCPEYKAWEIEINKVRDRPTETAPVSICSTTTTSTDDHSSTTPNNLFSTDDIQLHIPLMDSNEVREMRDTVMFEHIYPSLLEHINPETIDQIINEIQESEANIPPTDLNHVEETQDTLKCLPLKELTFETLDQIMEEIEESEVNIFNYDNNEDINDMINLEINKSMNELSGLEKELLRY